MTPSFCGMRVMLSERLTERVPYPRSPARAKRRAKLGHPQHMADRPMSKIMQIGPDTLVMHPATWAAVKAEMERKNR